MGLDNGLTVKGKDAQSFEDYTLDIDTEECYWRKQWAFRNEVVDYLNDKYPNTDEEYSWLLDKDDVTTIRKIQQDYLSREHWVAAEADRQNPWSYEEYIINNAKNLQFLAYLEKFLTEYPDAELEIKFYDSY